MANGILVIDKSAGWTSQDVAAKLRGVFHERRVGHGGTLDPMATGVLPIFIGRATRAAEFLESAEKEYIAGLRLGTVTDTQDTSGTALETHPVTVTRADVQAALQRFLGPIEQIPPMYSAIKIGGQKLYELARRGKEVERKPRSITIHELELLEGEGTEYVLRVRCSKGTYVRTLCHDIGAALGCGGCMSALRRTAAGGFTLRQAVTMQQILDFAAENDPQALLMPVDALFSRHPALIVTMGQAARIRMDRAATSLAPLDPKGDTIWLGVVDGQGNAVSLIQSIYHDFGSGIVPRGTGVLLQNRGSFFSLDPAHVNRLEPGKRTFHTLNPAMLTRNGKPFLVYGTMGGEGQPQTQAAIATRVLDYGMTPQEAIDAPRWLYGRTWGKSSNDLKLEGRISADVADELARRGPRAPGGGLYRYHGPCGCHPHRPADRRAPGRYGPARRRPGLRLLGGRQLPFPWSRCRYDGRGRPGSRTGRSTPSGSAVR